MRIIGIDPGPDGFAWAYMWDGVFVEWDECDMTPVDDTIHYLNGRDCPIAIEDITRPAQSKHELKTAKMVGRLQEIFKTDLLIPRIRVARSLNLAPNKKRGDAQINAAMCCLYPELRGRQPGLNSHTRAACAVAHAAIGVLQERKINAGND